MPATKRGKVNKNAQDAMVQRLEFIKEFRISDPIHPECLLVPQYT